MNKVEVKLLAHKIVSAIIDALFRSCSKKKPPDTAMDESRHPEPI